MESVGVWLSSILIVGYKFAWILLYALKCYQQFVSDFLYLVTKSIVNVSFIFGYKKEKKGQKMSLLFLVNYSCNGSNIVRAFEKLMR